jgi:hypothetical protein
MGRGQTAVNSPTKSKTMWRLTLCLAGLEGEQDAIVFGGWSRGCCCLLPIVFGNHFVPQGPAVCVEALRLAATPAVGSLSFKLILHNFQVKALVEVDTRNLEQLTFWWVMTYFDCLFYLEFFRRLEFVFGKSPGCITTDFCFFFFFTVEKKFSKIKKFRVKVNREKLSHISKSYLRIWS